ncbi:MAG: hypothetical protein IT287_00360 [Bdellovibrionaceae bacterium]|nr:hypothetical protein [Pseudobdellovibrionaceae bacterium]
MDSYKLESKKEISILICTAAIFLVQVLFAWPGFNSDDTNKYLQAFWSVPKVSCLSAFNESYLYMCGIKAYSYLFDNMGAVVLMQTFLFVLIVSYLLHILKIYHISKKYRVLYYIYILILSPLIVKTFIYIERDTVFSILCILFILLRLHINQNKKLALYIALGVTAGLIAATKKEGFFIYFVLFVDILICFRIFKPYIKSMLIASIGILAPIYLIFGGYSPNQPDVGIQTLEIRFMQALHKELPTEIEHTAQWKKINFNLPENWSKLSLPELQVVLRGSDSIDNSSMRGLIVRQCLSYPKVCFMERWRFFLQTLDGLNFYGRSYRQVLADRPGLYPESIILKNIKDFFLEEIYIFYWSNNPAVIFFGNLLPWFVSLLGIIILIIVREQYMSFVLYPVGHSLIVFFLAGSPIFRYYYFEYYLGLMALPIVIFLVFQKLKERYRII